MRLADYWHEFCARQGVREDNRDMRAVFMAGGGGHDRTGREFGRERSRG